MDPKTKTTGRERTRRPTTKRPSEPRVTKDMQPESTAGEAEPKIIAENQAKMQEDVHYEDQFYDDDD